MDREENYCIQKTCLCPCPKAPDKSHHKRKFRSYEDCSPVDGNYIGVIRKNYLQKPSNEEPLELDEETVRALCALRKRACRFIQSESDFSLSSESVEHRDIYRPLEKSLQNPHMCSEPTWIDYSPKSEFLKKIKERGHYSPNDVLIQSIPAYKDNGEYNSSMNAERRIQIQYSKPPKSVDEIKDRPQSNFQPSDRGLKGRENDNLKEENNLTNKYELFRTQTVMQPEKRSDDDKKKRTKKIEHISRSKKACNHREKRLAKALSSGCVEPKIKNPFDEFCERCWRFASSSRSPVNKPEQRYDPNFRRGHSCMSIIPGEPANLNEDKFETGKSMFLCKRYIEEPQVKESDGLREKKKRSSTKELKNVVELKEPKEDKKLKEPKTSKEKITKTSNTQKGHSTRSKTPEALHRSGSSGKAKEKLSRTRSKSYDHKYSNRPMTSPKDLPRKSTEKSRVAKSKEAQARESKPVGSNTDGNTTVKELVMDRYELKFQNATNNSEEHSKKLSKRKVYSLNDRSTMVDSKGRSQIDSLKKSEKSRPMEPANCTSPARMNVKSSYANVGDNNRMPIKAVGACLCPQSKQIKEMAKTLEKLCNLSRLPKETVIKSDSYRAQPQDFIRHSDQSHQLEKERSRASEFGRGEDHYVSGPVGTSDHSRERKFVSCTCAEPTRTSDLCSLENSFTSRNQTHKMKASESYKLVEPGGAIKPVEDLKSPDHPKNYDDSSRVKDSRLSEPRNHLSPTESCKCRCKKKAKRSRLATESRKPSRTKHPSNTIGNQTSFVEIMNSPRLSEPTLTQGIEEDPSFLCPHEFRPCQCAMSKQTRDSELQRTTQYTQTINCSKTPESYSFSKTPVPINRPAKSEFSRSYEVRPDRYSQSAKKTPGKSYRYMEPLSRGENQIQESVRGADSLKNSIFPTNSLDNRASIERSLHGNYLIETNFNPQNEGCNCHQYQPERAAEFHRFIESPYEVEFDQTQPYVRLSGPPDTCADPYEFLVGSDPYDFFQNPVDESSRYEFYHHRVPRNFRVYDQIREFVRQPDPHDCMQPLIDKNFCYEANPKLYKEASPKYHPAGYIIRPSLSDSKISFGTVSDGEETKLGSLKICKCTCAKESAQALLAELVRTQKQKKYLTGENINHERSRSTPGATKQLNVLKPEFNTSTKVSKHMPLTRPQSQPSEATKGHTPHSQRARPASSHAPEFSKHFDQKHHKSKNVQESHRGTLGGHQKTKSSGVVKQEQQNLRQEMQEQLQQLRQLQEELQKQQEELKKQQQEQEKQLLKQLRRARAEIDNENSKRYSKESVKDLSQLQSVRGFLRKEEEDGTTDETEDTEKRLLRQGTEWELTTGNEGGRTDNPNWRSFEDADAGRVEALSDDSYKHPSLEIMVPTSASTQPNNVPRKSIHLTEKPECKNTWSRKYSHKIETEYENNRPRKSSQLIEKPEFQNNWSRKYSQKVEELEIEKNRPRKTKQVDEKPEPENNWSRKYSQKVEELEIENNWPRKTIQLVETPETESLWSRKYSQKVEELEIENNWPQKNSQKMEKDESFRSQKNSQMIEESESDWSRKNSRKIEKPETENNWSRKNSRKVEESESFWSRKNSRKPQTENNWSRKNTQVVEESENNWSLRNSQLIEKPPPERSWSSKNSSMVEKPEGNWTRKHSQKVEESESIWSGKNSQAIERPETENNRSRKQSHKVDTPQSESIWSSRNSQTVEKPESNWSRKSSQMVEKSEGNWSRKPTNKVKECEENWSRKSSAKVEESEGNWSLKNSQTFEEFERYWTPKQSQTVEKHEFENNWSRKGSQTMEEFESNWPRKQAYNVEKPESNWSPRNSLAVEKPESNWSSRNSLTVEKSEGNWSRQNPQMIEKPQPESIWSQRNSQAVEKPENNRSRKDSQIIEKSDINWSRKGSQSIEESESNWSRRNSQLVEKPISNWSPKQSQTVEKPDAENNWPQKGSQTIEESESNWSRRNSQLVEKPISNWFPKQSLTVEKPDAENNWSRKGSQTMEESESNYSQKPSLKVEEPESNWSRKSSLLVEKPVYTWSPKHSLSIEESGNNWSRKPSPKVKEPEDNGSRKGTPKIEEPESNWSRKGTPKIEEPESNWSRKNTPKIEEPESNWSRKNTPKIEEPESNWSRKNTPKIEEPESNWSRKGTPKIEEPESNWSRKGTPKIEEPESNWSRKGTPKIEEPKSNWSRKGIPKIEEPESNWSRKGTPKIEEPKSNWSRKGTPKIEEPESNWSRKRTQKVEEPESKQSPSHTREKNANDNKQDSGSQNQKLTPVSHLNAEQSRQNSLNKSNNQTKNSKTIVVEENVHMSQINSREWTQIYEQSTMNKEDSHMTLNSPKRNLSVGTQYSSQEEEGTLRKSDHDQTQLNINQDNQNGSFHDDSLNSTKYKGFEKLKSDLQQDMNENVKDRAPESQSFQQEIKEFDHKHLPPSHPRKTKLCCHCKNSSKSKNCKDPKILKVHCLNRIPNQHSSTERQKIYPRTEGVKHSTNHSPSDKTSPERKLIDTHKVIHCPYKTSFNRNYIVGNAIVQNSVKKVDKLISSKNKDETDAPKYVPKQYSVFYMTKTKENDGNAVEVMVEELTQKTSDLDRDAKWVSIKTQTLKDKMKKMNDHSNVESMALSFQKGASNGCKNSVDNRTLYF